MEPAAQATWRAGELAAVKLPYLGIACVVLHLGGAGGDREISGDGAPRSRRTTRRRPAASAASSQFPRYWLGVFAQFAYVGAQVGVWSFLIRYTQFNFPGTSETIRVGLPVLDAGAVLRRALRRHLADVEVPARRRCSCCSPRRTWCLCLIAATTGGDIGLYALMATSFFMSIQFPTIFTMSLRGLGTYTKSGSSFLVMAIVGGALIPLVMGGVSDASTINLAMFVPAACFAVVMWFAMKSRGEAARPRMSAALARRELGRTGLELCTLGFGGAAIGNLYRELRDDDARRRGARVVRRRRTLLRHRAVLRLRSERAAPRQGAARRAAAAGDLHQGRPPPRAHRPAGCERGPRGIFLAAPVRAGIRLRLRRRSCARTPKASNGSACRASTSCCATTSAASRTAIRTPRACANSSTAAIAPCASCATAGAVRAIGLGVNEWEICVELLRAASSTASCSPAATRCSSSPRSSSLLPLCEQRSVSIICGGPFNSGILAAGSRAGAQRPLQLRRATRPRVLERVSQARRAVRGIRRALAGRGTAVSARASRASRAWWPAAPTARRRAIAPRCSRIPFPPAFWHALRERGLVDARAPLPA